jgi:hypothetical protein
MIRVFLGYRNAIGHILEGGVHSAPDDDFTQDVSEWSQANLTGYAQPVYVPVIYLDESGVSRRGARFEFEFDNERDAVLFKLFHIGS